MASENEQVVRRYLDHFNATGEPLWDLPDPEIVFVTRSDLGHSTYQGVEGIERATKSFREVWGDSIRLEVLEVFGEDSPLVAVMRFDVRGVASGAELEVDEGWAFWMRDGRFMRIEQHGSRERALESAGLSG